jgi:ubiquinol-cytochrome c reductase cytochrome c1 subunit
MMTKALFSSLAVAFVLFVSAPAQASGGGHELMEPEGGWPHEKIFGAHYDRVAAQRGFQIFKEVCASCHSLDLVAFRTLTGIGFNEDQVKAIAADYLVMAEPNDDGDVEEREAKPFDYFPAPFPNVQAAAAANSGAAPPDLSLITKARFGGASYVYSLMLGYSEPTEEDMKHLAVDEIPDTAYYNPFKAGGVIAMAPPLSEDLVEYSDVEGQPQATMEQMAYDIATFLAWTAEPKLEERKNLGFRFMSLLLILCGLLFFSYRRISKRVLGH